MIADPLDLKLNGRNHLWIFIEINFNGALNTDEASGDIGVVIRDVDGNVLGVCSTTHVGVLDPKLIEKAIDFTGDMGSNQIIFEGDAIGVIIEEEEEKSKVFF